MLLGRWAGGLLLPTAVESVGLRDGAGDQKGRTKTGFECRHKAERVPDNFS